MESDDLPRARPDDLLKALTTQDLSPLSVAELEARAAALDAEAKRTRDHAERAVNHRSSAEALFRR